MQPRTVCQIALVLLVFAPELSHAQRIEIGPSLGGLLPLGSYHAPAYFRTDLPTNPGDLSAYSVGGHLRMRFGRLGLQLEASQATATVGGGASPVSVLAPAHPRIQVASLQATYYLTPQARRTQSWLALGPAVVRYTDAGYSDLDSPTHLAGIIGSGLSIPLAGPVRAAFTASLAAYHVNIRDSQGASLERGPQLDSRFAVGLTWTLR